MKHVEIETLINKFEGRLAVADEHEIAFHLAECRECSSEAAKLANFFAYVEPHTADNVPQAVTARILNLYQRKPAAIQQPAKARSSIMSLIFDDWQMALSERYSGLDTRQMLYRAGDFEIDLRIELIGDLCRLTGQIFPESAGAKAEIISSSQTATAVLNEFGEFTFDPVPQGIYQVRFMIDNEELSIEEVPLHR